VRTLLFLFQGDEAPPCRSAADSNDDGRVDISNPIHALGFLFLRTAAPPAPGTMSCGADPTPDALDCLGESGC